MGKKELSPVAKVLLGIVVAFIVLNGPIIYYTMGMLWLNFINGFRVKEPNDDISQVISNELGGDFTYDDYAVLADDFTEMPQITGVKINDDYESVEIIGGIKSYVYIVKHSANQKSLEKMINVVDETIRSGVYGKVYIRICEEIPGGIEEVAAFCNFSETGEMYDKMQRVIIYGTDPELCDSLYDECKMYFVLKDIKSLSISQRMAQKAQEDEVDWYEVWPGLEFYEVME